jgi:transcriptional regulator with XRE-family HTH domain
VPVSRKETFVKRFGANLRRIRTAQGMSQERLAELVDLNVRNIQRIEAGEITVLISTAKRLRDAMKCSWTKLLD